MALHLLDLSSSSAVKGSKGLDEEQEDVRVVYVYNNNYSCD